jgi:hypothetical protein
MNGFSILMGARSAIDRINTRFTDFAALDERIFDFNGSAQRR